MPNQSRLVRGGEAEQFYRELSPESRRSLDEALDCLAENPTAPEIRSRDMPPVVIYRYRNNNWDVFFGRSYSRTTERYDLAIYDINPR